MRIVTPATTTATMATGAVLLAVGLVMKQLLPDIMKTFVAKKVVLNPEAAGTQIWMAPPPGAAHKHFYFFNYTNVDEFLSNWTSGVKPRVEELGPYTYSLTMKKVNMSWMNDEDLVQYQETASFHFVPEMSRGSLDDVITTPNVPVTAVIAGAEARGEGANIGALFDITSPTLFVARSIRELLFDGYVDATIEFVSAVMEEEVLPDNKFAFFYNANNSVGLPCTVHRGNDDVRKLGYLFEWNFTRKFPHWTGRCADIAGYVGPFPPGLDTVDRIDLALAEMGRTIFLKFDGKVERSGLQVRRYVLGPEAFGHPNFNPENSCYCSDLHLPCTPTGVYSLAPVKQGAPIYLSFPHFLSAESYLLDAIDGLAPNRERHLAFIELEPLSGGPVMVRMRLQNNVGWKRMENVKLLADIPDVILPIFWIEENVTMSSDIIEMMQGGVDSVGFVNKFPVVFITAGGVVALMGAIGAVVVMFKEQHAQRKQPKPIRTKIYPVKAFVPTFVS